jgi:glycosyltransferase involved in cell wall biosynthesis
MHSVRKKILWLASWYPNREDPFDGDFIQRHAQAAALYNDIHVIVVKESKSVESMEIDTSESEGLKEQVIYYKAKSGVLSGLNKQLKWRKVYLSAIKEYIKVYGKPDLIHVHVPWKAGLIALELKNRWGIPFIVTEHWGIYNTVLKDNYFSKPFYFKLALKLIYRNVRLLISPSEYLAKSIQSSIVPLDYVIIPNVVDTSVFHLNLKKHSKFTFLHVSNMVPLKNVDGIISAFKKLIEVNNLNDVQLVLVGKKENSYLENASKTGLLNKNIFFKGEIAYADVAIEMQYAHCLVLNSKMENSPCVIGEALCCGLPVIATKVGGIPELIHLSNGILIEKNQNDILAESMLCMFNNYPSFNLLSIAEEASIKFSNNNVGLLHHKVYQSF